jgi:DNA-binding response OmpR family regulator
MLPDYSGYDLYNEIVNKSGIPAIMLSAKNETIDKVLGLKNSSLHFNYNT